MKKSFVVLFATAFLFVGSNVYSDSYPQSYSDDCVDQCVDPCVDQCEAPGRFYIGAFGGANWLNMHHLRGHKSGAKGGFVGALSLGYQFDNGFRVEGEVAYRRNHVKREDRGYYYSDSSYDRYYDNNLSGSYNSGRGKSFYAHSWSYMANLLYDFNSFSCFCPDFVPYIGFGLGYSRQNDHHNRHDDYYYSDCYSYSVDFNYSDCDFYSDDRSHHRRKKEGGFAYQGIVGLGYNLTDSTILAVEYRYFANQKHNHDNSVGVALRQAF